MAYRLERDEPVIEGLKRVVREEIASAEERLSGRKKVTRNEAIHESRKSIKKVRATLRLVRDEMGDLFQRENDGLRDIAGRLSAFRDAFVMIQTFDALRKKYREKLGDDNLRSVRTGLTKSRRDAGSNGDIAAVIDEAASALKKLSKRVKTWPLKQDGYAAIAGGLEDSYRNGRRALARALRNPSAENFHELRKRVKDHWYHVRLLEGLWTELMEAREKSLKDLEDRLGNDHNLTVLRDKIAVESWARRDEQDVARTFELIGIFQKELRAEAIPLAQRIYQEKPRDFSRRMKDLWDTWRAEPAADAAD